MPGSVQPRGGNKYFLTVSDGFDISGKRRRFTKTVEASSHTEAEKLLAQFYTEVTKGKYTESKITLKDFLDNWLNDYAEKNLTDKTVHWYKILIEGRINDALGHIKLKDLKPTHLVQFYNNLTEPGIRKEQKKNKETIGKTDINKPLSDSTIKSYHRALSSALSTAVDWELISENPCEKVTPPKTTKRRRSDKVKHYEVSQAKDLLDALKLQPLKYQVMVYIDITTGIRREELMALRWSKIDFKAGSIIVDSAIEYVPGRGQKETVPKNESSERTVFIPKFVSELLKKYQSQQKEDLLKVGITWKEDLYIFTNDNGNLMHIDTISKWFPKFLAKYDLPKITFHGLRHSAASILMDKGLNLKALSEFLGHAQSSTTLNIYSHAMKSANKEAADIMDRVFGDKKSPKKSKKKKA